MHMCMCGRCTLSFSFEMSIYIWNWLKEVFLTSLNFLHFRRKIHLCFCFNLTYQTVITCWAFFMLPCLVVSFSFDCQFVFTELILT